VGERPEVSVVLITRNEAGRIRRCLDSVRWADEIVVVDQHSRDDTAAICRAYGARVLEREMHAGFGEQKNFAIAQASRPWILSLDADEEVTPALRRALETAVAAPGACVGFRMPRLTSYLGRFIRHCGWYPSPVLRLFRRGAGRFTDALVHEEVVVDGPVGELGEDLLHHSYDSLADHVRKLLVYTAYDARTLQRRGVRLGPLSAVWWLLVKPAAVFVRKFFLQAGFREGWHGLVLSAMAALVVLVNAVRLAELTGRLGRPPADEEPATAPAEPPTVLLVANFADVVGGGEASLLGLAAALDRRHLRVLASVTAEGEVAARLRRLAVPVSVVALPPVRPWTLPAAVVALRRLRALLAGERVALVHAHGSRGALYAGLAARGLGVPLVWHVRVADADPRLDPLLARLASSIVVNSAATAARLRRVPVAADKLTIVPNGVDLVRFAPRPADPALRTALGLDPALPVVAYFGRLEHGKGVDVLLDAAARVHAKLPAAFVLVGDGPLRAPLAARAAAAGLPVRFVGQRDDVPELLGLCAVVVLPSRQEAFGRVLIEAMAAGVPVVATAVGGIPEVCTDGVTGLLVPPEDPDALAAAIARTLTDQAATAARVAAAAADVRARFDVDAHAARVQAVYARVLARGGSARGPAASPPGQAA
jgi:glycosyltransferase involved in cell wall biosynthesis